MAKISTIISIRSQFSTKKDSTSYDFVLSQSNDSTEQQALKPNYQYQDEYHLVKAGEFPGRIAEKYGIGLSKLRQWNNLHNDRIIAGQKLVVKRTLIGTQTEVATNKNQALSILPKLIIHTKEVVHIAQLFFWMIHKPAFS